MSVTIQQPVEAVHAAHGATRAEHVKLKSTGGPIPDSIGSLRSFNKDTPIEELREAYEKDGYIWIKGLLPVEDVLKCRGSYFTYLSDTGLLKKGTSPRDGIYCGANWRMWIGPGKLRRKFGHVQDTAYTRKMVAAHSASWYREFCDHPDMKDFIERFSSWSSASLLKRSLLRPNIPGGEITQVHYDQIFLRARPPTSLTVWVPVGDCPMEGGGLLYLENSVSLGQQLEAQFNAAAASLTDEERISAFNKTMMDTGYLEKDAGKFSKLWGRRWLAADYKAGDVVIHNPYMIHCSALNEHPDGVIRLATDLRYYETGTPHDTRWEKVWTVSICICTYLFILTTCSSSPMMDYDCVEMAILGGGESVIATETSTRYEPRNGRVELCVVLLGILADSA
jgi:phytanoyl-CoA hydroxylase